MNCGGWSTIRITQNNIIGVIEQFHSVPNGDYRLHDIWPTCWCNPTECEPGCFLHNALDGRKSYEEGRKLQ